jgi:hypothetical protein
LHVSQFCFYSCWWNTWTNATWEKWHSQSKCKAIFLVMLGRHHSVGKPCTSSKYGTHNLIRCPRGAQYMKNNCSCGNTNNLELRLVLGDSMPTSACKTVTSSQQCKDKKKCLRSLNHGYRPFFTTIMASAEGCACGQSFSQFEHTGHHDKCW